MLDLHIIGEKIDGDICINRNEQKRKIYIQIVYKARFKRIIVCK